MTDHDYVAALDYLNDQSIDSYNIGYRSNILPIVRAALELAINPSDAWQEALKRIATQSWGTPERWYKEFAQQALAAPKPHQPTNTGRVNK